MIELIFMFVQYHAFGYGFEDWPLTWREQGRLRLFENRVLRRIFGPKMDGGKTGVQKTT